jgi:hypothetical protein
VTAVVLILAAAILLLICAGLALAVWDLHTDNQRFRKQLDDERDHNAELITHLGATDPPLPPAFRRTLAAIRHLREVPR